MVEAEPVMLQVVSLAEYTPDKLVCVARTGHWYDDLGGTVEHPSLVQVLVVDRAETGNAGASGCQCRGC